MATITITTKQIITARSIFQPALTKLLNPRKDYITCIILPNLERLPVDTDTESVVAITKPSPIRVQQRRPYYSTVLRWSDRHCIQQIPSLSSSSRTNIATVQATTDQRRNSNYYYSLCKISNSSQRSMSTVTTTNAKPVFHQMNENDMSTTTNVIDIEELHERACELGQMSYIDPVTGFTCFTRIAHLKRGICCGNYCRHCPYQWKNAKATNPKSSDDDDDDNDASSCSDDESCQAKSNCHHKSLPMDMNELSLNGQSTPETTSSDTTTVSTSTASSKTGGKYGGTLTKKNVVYTRGGDTGTSQLLNGERRMKSDIVFEALGTVDELCSIVGVCYAELTEAIQKSMQREVHDVNHTMDQIKELGLIQEWLLEIMSRLFDIGSHVANPRKKSKDDFVPDGVGNGFDMVHIQELEVWIDTMTEALPELTSFVLPTGSRTSAQLHVARTVCRRTERTIVPLVVVHNNDTINTITSGCDPNALAYINRLSDFFFTAARYVNDRLSVPDIAYQRPTRAAKQRTRVVLKSPNATE